MVCRGKHVQFDADEWQELDQQWAAPNGKDPGDLASSWSASRSAWCRLADEHNFTPTDEWRELAGRLFNISGDDDGDI